VSFDDYVAPGGPRREVERLIQLVVEVAVDCAAHIVAELEDSAPAGYQDAFARAARAGILPAELAQRLAPAGGLRNLIVHRYGDIDDRRVHSFIAAALDGFDLFGRAIRAWLDAHHPEDTAG
jgi:uncharacterized protein YutE (UPF0331/DUF86 family)